MIISRTPFRISFSGGGTDLREYYSLYGGAVLSMAIDRYMYITVNRSFDDRLRISYAKTEITYNVEEIQHPLVRETLKLVGIKSGVEITSVADVPSGTGLGSSSSFTVGLLNALYAFKGEMRTAQQLAEEACKIEIDIVKEPIGKQDQFIASYGGLEFITFNPDESVYADPVICPAQARNELLSRLMLFYVGQERAAGSILADQKKAVPQKAEAMKGLVDIAKKMKKILEQGDLSSEFGKLLHQSWLIKKSLSGKISNPSINEIYEKALSAGALGGKLLGAGSGGFMLFFVEKSHQDKVKQALSPLRLININLELQGSKIIYVG